MIKMFFYFYSITFLVLLFLGLILGDSYGWLAIFNYLQYFLFLPLPIFWIIQFFQRDGRKFIVLLLLTFIWTLDYTPINYPKLAADFTNAVQSKIKDPESSFNFPLNQDEIVGDEITFISMNLDEMNYEDYPSLKNIISKHNPTIIAMQNTDISAIKNVFKGSEYQDYNFFDSIIFSRISLKPVEEISSMDGVLQILQSIYPINGRKLYFANISTTPKAEIHEIFKKNKLKDISKNNAGFVKIGLGFLKHKGIDNSKVLIASSLNLSQKNAPYRSLETAGFRDTHKSSHVLLPWKTSFTYPRRVQTPDMSKTYQTFPFLRHDYIFAGRSLEIIDSGIIPSELDMQHEIIFSSIR